MIKNKKPVEITITVPTYLKELAAEICFELGVSTEQAIKLFLIKLVSRQGLSFKFDLMSENARHQHTLHTGGEVLQLSDIQLEKLVRSIHEMYPREYTYLINQILMDEYTVDDEVEDDPDLKDGPDDVDGPDEPGSEAAPAAGVPEHRLQSGVHKEEADAGTGPASGS